MQQAWPFASWKFVCVLNLTVLYSLMAAAQAHVVRDGQRRSVDAGEIVAGDLMLVEEGHTIAADARIIQSTALGTSEAALTGESLPVSKHAAPLPPETALADRTNMLYSGTTAAYGRAKAIVVATGMRSRRRHGTPPICRGSTVIRSNSIALTSSGSSLGSLCLGAR